MLKKILKYLLLITPVALLVIYLTVIHIPEISLTDTDGSYIISFDSDIKSGGTTQVFGRVIDDNKYEFSYELGNSTYPYAVLKIINKDNEFIDLTDYSHLRIKLKSSGSDNLIFHAYAYIEGITILDNFSTYLPLDLKIPTDSSMKEHYLPIKDLKVPAWWYIDNGISDPSEVKISMESIYYIEISNSNTEAGFKDTVIIKDITLCKSLFRVAFKSLVMVLIYYTVFFILLILYRRNRVKIKRAKAGLEEKASAYEISKRELEVIELLFEGLKYKEISEKLFISLSTVKKHVTSVYRKTGTSNKVELISKLT